MNFEITKKFLIFPVNTLSLKKELHFKIDGKTVYKINIRLDNCNPDFYAYINMSRFIGQKIEIAVYPEMEINFRESDTMDIENLYNEPMRPQIHFTTKNGWINDPNGLIYLDGVYHMFFQFNPTEPKWDNMHWGHAESRDLIHWEEKDTALFPDNRGTMFSGSAIYDEKNLLGINPGESKATLLYYTTTNPFCQYMSYSTDKFKTIEIYEKKPVVPHITGCNRDPKVVFCDELNCYIMALYLEHDVYALLTSKNLVDWNELQRIRLNGDNECPDIFSLYCNNGERKWILMGAHDKYIVGIFKNGKFFAEQSESSLHYGSSGYAGQSFSNLPDGRVVRMVWNRWKLTASCFNGQMGIPMEMTLCKHEDIYYLEANPVKEIESIYTNMRFFNNISVNPENEFVEALDDTAQLLRIRSSLFECGNLTIEIFGRTINFDFTKNEIKFGNCTAPISLIRSILDTTIIIDRCSIELFADGGKIMVSCLNEDTFMDRNLPYIKINADTDIILDRIEINSLESIWGE